MKADMMLGWLACRAIMVARHVPGGILRSSRRWILDVSHIESVVTCNYTRDIRTLQYALLAARALPLKNSPLLARCRPTETQTFVQRAAYRHDAGDNPPALVDRPSPSGSDVGVGFRASCRRMIVCAGHCSHAACNSTHTLTHTHSHNADFDRD